MEIQKRDLLIAYEIDKKSVAELSANYGLNYDEMKTVLRTADIRIRKDEIKESESKVYPKVIIIDGVQEVEVSFNKNTYIKNV